MIIPDIDIDFANPQDALKHLTYINASQVFSGELTKHNSGVYLTSIPVDSSTGLAAIPYKEAEKRGYFKVDFLTLKIYEKVKDNDHLDKLLNTEPLWEMLEYDNIVNGLFQIRDHFDIVDQIKPTSIEELAVVIALIRPGKRHLLYETYDDILENIWKPDSSGFTFKKSHAISYAMVIVVQMNLQMDDIDE